MLQDSGRSRVIACHSRDIGNILLYYYHLKNINGGKENDDRTGIWFGIGGCKRLCHRGCGAWLGYTAEYN